MKESITLFRQAINDSADLQEKCNSIRARATAEVAKGASGEGLDKASGEGLKDLVELGKENGHEFSAEELKEAYEQLQGDEDGELTEFEMAAVAGGFNNRGMVATEGGEHSMGKGYKNRMAAQRASGKGSAPGDC